MKFNQCPECSGQTNFCEKEQTQFCYRCNDVIDTDLDDDECHCCGNRCLPELRYDDDGDYIFRFSCPKGRVWYKNYQNVPHRVYDLVFNS